MRTGFEATASHPRWAACFLRASIPPEKLQKFSPFPTRHRAAGKSARILEKGLGQSQHAKTLPRCWIVSRAPHPPVRAVG